MVGSTMGMGMHPEHTADALLGGGRIVHGSSQVPTAGMAVQLGSHWRISCRGDRDPGPV